MWNLFTVGSLQFCNDSRIASLEANPKQHSGYKGVTARTFDGNTLKMKVVSAI